MADVTDMHNGSSGGDWVCKWSMVGDDVVILVVEEDGAVIGMELFCAAMLYMGGVSSVFPYVEEAVKRQCWPYCSGHQFFSDFDFWVQCQ